VLYVILGRWIGKGGPIAWPPRPHDLNLLDFYLWSHLKSLVNSSPVDDLETPKSNYGRFQAVHSMPGIWDHAFPVIC
jgi:hypothetical protein